MVCVECIVVPVMVLLVSFVARWASYCWNYLFPSSSSADAATRPPPFNPASINLAAHGLPSSDTSTKAAAKEVEADEEPIQDETKEGPAVKRRAAEAN